MNAMKKLYSSVAATSAMTLFSYFFSLLSGTNLREPHILAQLTGRLMPWHGERKNILTGWILHNAVGLLFSEMYEKFWEHTSINNKKKAGLIFGGLAGLAAILIWQFTLNIHPIPPFLNFGLFALNLFLGHLVFGMVAALTSP
jgi:hypothetical protein